MRKFLFIIICMFSLNTHAELFKCSQLKGWEVGLSGDKPKQTETTDKNGCDYIIEKDTAYLYCDGQKASECVVFQNNKERVDFICAGTLATSYYTISKNGRKIRYVKNGIINGLSYSMMMSGDCK